MLVLLGARRVGKTIMLEKIMSQAKEKILFLNGDDFDTHKLLEQQTKANFESVLGDCRFLIIDEAQEIPNIGKKLKLMVDTIKNLKVLVTGSSAFEINNQIGEPLVGRMNTLHLFPLAQMEFNPNSALKNAESNK